MINDLYIINFFYKNDKINSNKSKLLNSNDLCDIKLYLDNRFKDKSESYIEIINRIKYNIETRPTCKYCGKEVKWLSKNKYREYCSCSCRNKNEFNNIKEKSTQHYGTPFNRSKFKETIIENFGEDNWCNRKKQKETVKTFSIEKKENINKKRLQTSFEKYGDEHFNNREKAKLTFLSHYNVDNWFKTDECKLLSKQAFLENKEEIIKKIQLSNLLKYGSKGFNHYKASQTKLEKYGDENYNNREKYINTCLERYGVINVFSKIENKLKCHSVEAFNKSKKTSIERYGVQFPIQSPIIQERIYQTKKKNNSFNISKPEDESYLLLKEKYPDIKRQYKDDRYPFACDFYIPSLDLFIECNYHWTHGKKLFEGTEDDNIKLNTWKNKNTKFYNNAIYTWTDLDVRKYNIAKENNLNYLVFYDLNNLIEWLNN